ncbi:MAG: polymer-forming cytoskeletal protein [Terracidiphilus sp.]|jgi:cytoskeletal protein CcmA (bactofilin family)
MPLAANESTLGKGLIVRGEITGTVSLFIDGGVEGSINLPGECVTVGQNGRITASMTTSMNVCITAREIVVMGNISGNVTAERVDVRAEGKLIGDISTCRIRIADGAFFKGSINIRKSDGKPAANTPPQGPHLMA